MNKKVVIIGGGFGGLNAAKALAKVRGLHVTLIDRRNHHLFQPLLYQVAMAGLSPAEIASPIRAVLALRQLSRPPKFDAAFYLPLSLPNSNNFDRGGTKSSFNF